jgi:hypothetical protein
MTAPRDGLREEAERRWESLAAARPDLRPAIDLQRLLVTEMIALLGCLDEQPSAVPELDAAIAAASLARGIPALRGAPVDVPVAILGPGLDRCCRHLANGGAGEVARHLLETFETGRLNRGSLIAASLVRGKRAIEAGANQMGLSPDLVWLVGELAAAPLAHRLQQRLFAASDVTPAVGQALEAWDRGCCPACGSWPALIEYLTDRRLLRCSFCAAAWELRSRRCVYCGEDGEAFSVSVPVAEEPRHLLESCTQCGGYTKAIRVDRPADFPLVAIADLETLALDQAAMAREYGRPPLTEFPDDAAALARPCQD